MKKLILLLAIFGLINSPAHTAPSRGQVLGSALAAAVTADIVRNGKQSFLGRNAIQMKEDIATFVSLATSKQPLREKLTTLRQLFGRNWGKMTLFFLFVIMPLVQKYRNDSTWLKSIHPAFKQPVLQYDTKSDAIAAAAQIKPRNPKHVLVPRFSTAFGSNHEAGKYVLGRKTTWSEFLKGNRGREAFDGTKLPDGKYFSRKHPIGSIANILAIPSAVAYRPRTSRTLTQPPRLASIS